MKNWLAVVLLLLAPVLMFAQDGDQASTTTTNPPSTAEERARALEVTNRIQAEPLNPRYQADRQWLLQWIEKIPDITVPICPDLLPVTSKGQDIYKYANQLRWQTIASSASFLINHPKDKDNDFAINQAAVEGALLAYQNILKSRPRAHWQALDDLLDKQKAGTLQDWIKRQTFHCLESGNNLMAELGGLP